MRTVEGDDNDTKIIMLALGDGDNENAFQQDITLGTDMIFQPNDALAKPQILARLKVIFDRFEALKRYKLRESTIKWDSGQDGELVLSFMYVNLESDEEKEFRRAFRGQSQGER